MKKLIIVIIFFASCKGESKFTRAIISGNDTMIITTNGVDVSKANGTHGYWNKSRDTLFTEFTNSKVFKGGEHSDTSYIMSINQTGGQTAETIINNK